MWTSAAGPAMCAPAVLLASQRPLLVPVPWLPEHPATTSSATQAKQHSATGPANRAVPASGRLLFREYCVVLTVLAVDGRGRFSRTCHQGAGQLPRRPSAHKVIEPHSRRDAPRFVGQPDDPSARGAGIAARPPSCADSWFRVSERASTPSR